MLAGSPRTLALPGAASIHYSPSHQTLSPADQSCICFLEPENPFQRRVPQLFKPVAQHPWRPQAPGEGLPGVRAALHQACRHGFPVLLMQAQELDGMWEEEVCRSLSLAGCSPSGHRASPAPPRTRAPVSVQLLDKQQAFLSLSTRSAWAVTPSCPLRRARHTLFTTPHL